MFRYSRDVKRCGPGTKAGAPVGVVYCLSTSSFFILMLTLELNVSAFGVGDGLSNMLAEFNAGQYEPLGSSLQAGSSQNHELRLRGHARAPILPRCSRAFQAFLDSMAARASAKLSRIRSRMILGASLLDLWTSSATSLVFLTVASKTRRANSACLVATS